MCGLKVKEKKNKYCSKKCYQVTLFGNTYRVGKKWSAETSKLFSSTTKGKSNLKRRGYKPWNKGFTIGLDDRIKSIPMSEVHKEKLKILFKGRTVPMEIRKRNSKISKKLWQDSEYAKKTLRARFSFPNKAEILLSKLCTNFEYVGDGRKIIAYSRPDFLHLSKNKVIELFGCYWHKCLEHFPNSIHKNDEHEKIRKYCDNRVFNYLGA